MLLEQADGGKAVHRITGKAADAFGNDQVDLPGQRVLDHPIEAVPVLCVQSADPFIRVHIHKLPIRIRANELCLSFFLSKFAQFIIPYRHTHCSPTTYHTLSHKHLLHPRQGIKKAHLPTQASLWVTDALCTINLIQ